MDGSQPGELGVLGWCNMIRLTMAQDPGRAFLDQQIQQQGFEFLESYLSNVVSQPKEDSVYELLKTPGRRKAPKRTRATTTKGGSEIVFTLEATIPEREEKENVVPVNNFHKALLQAKEDAGKSTIPDSSPTDAQMEDATNITAKEDSVTCDHEDDEVPMDIEPEEPSALGYTRGTQSPATILHSNVELEDKEGYSIDLPTDYSAPNLNYSPADLVKELSIIAEDDEERSRVFQELPQDNGPMAKSTIILVNDTEPGASAVLPHKLSSSSLPNLPAPSPLQQSVRLPREPSSSSIVAPALAHTPGTVLGGKRTSWLTKAKELKALELATNSGKKSDPVDGSFGPNLGAPVTSKKRKSGEMLGQPVPESSEIRGESAERRPKSAKVVEVTRDSRSQPEEQTLALESDTVIPIQAARTSVASQKPTTTPSFGDDFTVPLADLSQEGALNKIKRTVEGLGARTKSMGKSLGGNAAAALAEARAAAQARVAERYKEEGVEVATEVSPPSDDAQPSDIVPSDSSAERRLSVSDLIPSAPSQKSSRLADISVSTTPPNSPPLSKHQKKPTAPPPVFSKPPVFVAPPAPPLKDQPFQLPSSHPFSLPPAVALGVHSASPPHHLKSQGLSAQSSKSSVFSDGIFSVKGGTQTSTQDTEYYTQLTSQEQGIIDDDDSWHSDTKLKASQVWTPFGASSADKDDTMTWSTAKSTSQKGGDTGPVDYVEDTRDNTGAGGPFDFQPDAPTDQTEVAVDMSMDVDDEYEDELEDIALTGKSTISLVQQDMPRSQSQQSMASSSSSQSQQLGFFGQATKLMSSMLGGGKKGKAEPVKSIQRAAFAAKKQQEEAEKKATRLKEMELRRQQTMQKKAEEEKLRAQEEEKKYKEELEKRRKEREELTEKKPLRSAMKKVVVEIEKRAETKKPPSREQPSRLGKATTPATRSAQMSKPPPPATPTQAPVIPASSSKEAVAKSIKPLAPFGTLKSMASIKGKEKAHNLGDADQQPSQLVQNQMANRAKVQMQAAQTPREPPRVASESIVLPEINSEYSDSEDEDRPRKFDPPNWAQSPELRQALQQQSTMNPDDIFGRIGPLRMEEIFKSRTSRFRARTSSANWSGADQLTAEEEQAYAKRMGYQ